MSYKTKWLFSSRLLRSLTLVLAVGGFSAQAAINEITYTRDFDGTPGDIEGSAINPQNPTAGFDTSSGDGLDTGPTNDIVRTNDLFQYTVSLSYTGSETNVRLVATLPKGDVAPKVGQAVAAWEFLPGYCKTGSGISTDKQTLTCVIGDITTTGTGTTAVQITARVLSTTPNKTSLPAPNLSITATGTVPAPINTPAKLAVSAAPFYDVVVQGSYNGNPRAFGFSSASGPANEDGFFHRPLVGLVAKNPNGYGRKGVEQLAGPINFSLDVSGYPSSVRLDTWHDGTAPYGTPAASQGFLDGCGSPANGSPSAEMGGSLNMYGMVNDAGPLAAQPTNSLNTVPNGGDCTVPSSSATTINLQVTGTDTSLLSRPTEAFGTKTQVNDWWVMNKALALWTPLSAYPSGTTQDTIKLNSYSGTSITGQPIRGDNPDNNTWTHNIIVTDSGSATKVFSQDASLPYPYRTECDPAYSGDCITNYMSPHQSIRSQIRYFNTGAMTQTNVYSCDIIDRTVFDIGSNFSASLTGVPGTIRYGVKQGSPYFASTDSGNDNTAKANSSTPRGSSNTNSSSDYSTARCDDTSIKWYNTVAEAQAAGGLVYVRADMPSIPGGTNTFLYIQGLTLRETYAATINVNWPTPSVRQAGTPIPDKTYLRNVGNFGSASLPTLSNTIYWDNVQVVALKTNSRVKKTVISPTINPVESGTTMTYNLQPTFTTGFPPVARTFTVTDILPPGLSYAPGSATVGGIGREPTITNNSPAAGYTKLVWTYPNQVPFLLESGTGSPNLPPVVFKASISPALSNTTLINAVAVSGGPDDYSSDCTYSTATNSFGTCDKASSVMTNVQTAPGFKITKNTPTSLIEVGQPFKFTVSYVSLGNALTTKDIPDLIDILPFTGDGTANTPNSYSGRKNASIFSGAAYQFQSVTLPSNDSGATVFYTKAAPTTINNDPRASTNTIPGGSTVWCSTLSGGDCPADASEVTAVRVRPSQIAANAVYNFDLNFVSTSLSQTGNVFGNSVGARAIDPASTLLYIETESVTPVKVVAASLSGTVFEDVNQNGGLDSGTDKGLPGVCVALTGTTSSSIAVSYSTLTGADGTYKFTGGMTNAIYTSTDCTGTPLPTFGGLHSGTYTVTEVNQPAGYMDGKDYAGTSGGTVGNDTVTAIPLGVGAAASGYNFTEFKGQLSIEKDVTPQYLKVTPDPGDETKLTYIPDTQALTYTIKVTNSSPVAMENVVVKDPIPSGLSLVESSPPAQVSGQDLTFNLGTLAANASQSITVKVKLSGTGVTPNTNQQAFLNTATALAKSVPEINSNTARTDIVYTRLMKRVQNLGIDPTTSVPQQPGNWKMNEKALPKSTLEYCINFYNYGTVPLKNYVITDNIDRNTKLVNNSWVVYGGTMESPSPAPAGATVSATGNTVQATIPELGAGQSGVLCFRVTVN